MGNLPKVNLTDHSSTTIQVVFMINFMHNIIVGFHQFIVLLVGKPNGFSQKLIFHQVKTIQIKDIV